MVFSIIQASFLQSLLRPRIIHCLLFSRACRLEFSRGSRPLDYNLQRIRHDPDRRQSYCFDQEF